MESRGCCRWSIGTKAGVLRKFVSRDLPPCVALSTNYLDFMAKPSTPTALKCPLSVDSEK